MEEYAGDAPREGACTCSPHAYSADDKPKMDTKLQSTGSVIMSTWIIKDLTAFDRRASQFRLANPWYVPTLSEWVEPSTWIRISEDMLDECDKTEDGPPNDVAVESFLRGEGRYV